MGEGCYFQQAVLYRFFWCCLWTDEGLELTPGMNFCPSWDREERANPLQMYIWLLVKERGILPKLHIWRWHILLPFKPMNYKQLANATAAPGSKVEFHLTPIKKIERTAFDCKVEKKSLSFRNLIWHS